MLFASLGILEISCLLIGFIILTLFTETEKFGLASLSTVTLLIVAQWLQWVDFLGFIKAHALVSAAYLGGFVVAGVIWSFVKWFSFLMRFRDVLRESTVSGSEHYGKAAYRGVSLRKQPLAAENKARITAWMIFWPFSMVGTVLNDPVRRIFNFLFGRFKQQYQKLSDHIFRDVKFKDGPATRAASSIEDDV